MVAAFFVGVGWIVGYRSVLPPADPTSSQQDPILYEVTVGRVGRSLTFNAEAEWSLTPLARTSTSGTVTSIEVASGEMVSAGQALLTVNLRPTFAAQGVVPMFRDLSGGSAGPDVAQLQQLLADLGLYLGDIDGEFGDGTEASVKAWQASLGLTNDGVVAHGDLVFIPQLPARLALAPEIVVGSVLLGGEQTIFVYPDAPDFRIVLGINQRETVPLTGEVTVGFADGMWQARVVQTVERTAQGQLVLVLGGVDAGPVCSDECALHVPLSGVSNYRAEIVIVPETSGPLIPVAAISTNLAGEAGVTLANGDRIPIVVLESSAGLAIVSGIEPGTEIVMPSSGANQ